MVCNGAFGASESIGVFSPAMVKNTALIPVQTREMDETGNNTVQLEFAQSFDSEMDVYM